jgi:1,4-alpha-glucan branching enzyme
MLTCRSWLGDDKLPLMDVNTEDQEVIDTLQAYIKNFVQEYKIDGLRIDGKHAPLRSQRLKLICPSCQTRPRPLLARILRRRRSVLHWRGVRK